MRISENDIANQLMWVAEADKVVGCVSLTPRPDTRHSKISSFFIHPDYKRRGVGKRLWKAVLEHTQNAGLTHLQLDADPGAVAFYEAMGFKTIGQVKSGSIPGRFLPLMEITVDHSKSIIPSRP